MISLVAALAFGLTNGFHDSANAVAALVATRAARPGAALVLVGTCHLAGPLVVGTAVADTVGGVVALPAAQVVPAVAAALTSAMVWNVGTWWFGLPSSSSHALVGACAATSGFSAVRWGGFHQGHVQGVLGVLVGLALSPLLGAGSDGPLRGPRGGHCVALAGASTRRCVEANGVLRAALAFSHGANDAQKTMGVITLLLVATGYLAVFQVPLSVKLVAAASLTVGTGLGGWRIVRTVGRGIYRLRTLDGLVSQGGALPQ